MSSPGMFSPPWVELVEDLELKSWESVDPNTMIVMPHAQWRTPVWKRGSASA